MQETYTNLLQAYVGESQARNRYTFYAKVAKEEGYVQISNIFLETAEQERQHASWFWKMAQNLKEKNPDLKEESVLDGVITPTVLGDTATNLKAAAKGENFEWTSMYPKFADIAKKEGYPDIAARIRAISKAEAHHEERYLKLLKEVENDFFKRDTKIYWVCAECGYVHEGIEPPKSCPSCSHSSSYFYRKSEEY